MDQLEANALCEADLRREKKKKEKAERKRREEDEEALLRKVAKEASEGKTELSKEDLSRLVPLTYRRLMGHSADSEDEEEEEARVEVI